jgi:hypothetical protein
MVQAGPTRTRRWLALKGFCGPPAARRLGLCGAASLLSLGLAGSASAAAPSTGDAAASIAAAPAGTVAGSMSGGYYHTCGMRTNGTVACSGDDSSAEATPPIGFD